MNPAFWEQFWRQFEGEWIENAFRLNHLAGVGGFGAVFLADHVVAGRLLRRVAVKLVGASDSMDRQLDELMTATTLHHDNVLRCFHGGSVALRESTLLFLVMEVAEDTLEARLKKGRLTAGEVVAMTAQIASALAYLHRQKLVHRDLKPANVLLVEGVWKLSDFGTVRQSFGAATDHTVGLMGTIAYMPPESFSGTVSPAWDIWSLGVLLLEALTGKGPFPDTTQNELIGAIVQRPPEIPRGLPEPFGDIVPRCLTKNYRERWTAQDLVEALRLASLKRVAALLNDARRYRETRRWTEALESLREAQRINASSTEVNNLIEEIEKQQREDEAFLRQLAEMRARAVQAASASDLDGAVRIWREVLELNPGDEAAEKGVHDVLAQRMKRLKLEVAEALNRDDTVRAGELVAELHRMKHGSPSGGPPTVTERIIPRQPQRRWREIAPWGIALLAAVIAVGVWMFAHNKNPAPTATKVVAPRMNPKDGLVYAWIPPGTFMMGCSPGDTECWPDEKPSHQVTITKGFWIGRTEVTQAAYRHVTGRDPSHWKGANLPVDSISWIDADAYCKSIDMRLPTEAEWEYAARGGSHWPRYGPVDAVAWFDLNGSGKTHEVAQKKENGYSLYDVLGNVAEWVSDWGLPNYYASSPTQDPTGPSNGSYRAIRGGSVSNTFKGTRATFRYTDTPGIRSSNNGVRCAGNSLPSVPERVYWPFRRK